MAEPHAYDDHHDLNALMRQEDDPLLNFTELLSPLQQNAFSFDPSSLGDPFVFDVDDEMLEDGFPTQGPHQTNVDNTNRWSDFGNPIQLPDWPLQAPPYTCSCCHVLREIVHTNGVEITKLEVHGRLGVVSHAVLVKYGVDGTTNQSREYKMFDFCRESIRRVKQFLVEYCKERKANGYVMLQDPLSAFYEAVCVGLDGEYSNTTDTDDPGDHQMKQADGEGSGARSSSNKTPLSIQRERAGKLTIRDLVGYFHFPIEVAAKEVQVCPTVIKKICRKHGLSRWPYRKINSIERKISTTKKRLTSADAEERRRAQVEINKLQQEIEDIYARFHVN